jgi:hypothetical protein
MRRSEGRRREMDDSVYLPQISNNNRLQESDIGHHFMRSSSHEPLNQNLSYLQWRPGENLLFFYFINIHIFLTSINMIF